MFTLFSGAAMAGADGAIHVIDGDTLRVGGVKIRLHGIDAPELDQTCRTEHGQAWACGRWVKEIVTDRLEGKVARCEALGTDRYGRMIATCTVDGRNINAVIVEDGLAFAYRKYSARYTGNERRARKRGAGLWAMQVQSPEQFRRAQSKAERPAQKSEKSCNIKGNISSKGKRIYHVPGQKYYSRTRISSQKGERWFCSEAQARKAGWRRSRV